MNSRLTLRARLGLAAAAAVLLPATLTATPALAHDALSSTAPAQDAVLTTGPDTVSLTLSQPPTDSATLNLSVITVTDGAGTTVSDGTVTVSGPTLTTKTVPGTPGTHNVLWRAVSSDGHPIEGKYSFTVQGPAQASTPAAPATAAPTATQATAPAPVPARPPNDDNAPLAVGIALGLLAAGLAATLFIRRRNSNNDA